MARPEEMNMSSPSDPDVEPSLLRPKDAARLLDISERFLRRLSMRGEIPCVRIGPRALRYCREDLALFIERQRARQARST
jgi:excisionase family DNA binding protein